MSENITYTFWSVALIWLILVLQKCQPATAFTAEVKMESCYDTTRRGYGFRVTNGPIVSKVNCTMYFEAPDPGLYMAVRLNSVRLPRIGQSCPTFIVYTFSAWRTDPVEDEWRGSEVSVPADPQALLSCNCTNYLQRCSSLQFDETNGPNLKIMLSYNPDDPRRIVNREDAFDVTISSFLRGASFVCPSGYFSCWHYRYRCLPKSLVCDRYDNCYDNSDEFDYSCSGRIANMTLPVFIIMVLACVVVFAILVFIVAALVRRRIRRRRLERNEWGEVIKTRPSPHQAYSVPIAEPMDQPQQQQQFHPSDSLPMGFKGGDSGPLM